jgi:hypothetical protein
MAGGKPGVGGFEYFEVDAVHGENYAGERANALPVKENYGSSGRFADRFALISATAESTAATRAALAGWLAM